MVYLVFGPGQLILINQPILKEPHFSDEEKHPLRPMMSNGLGVSGNTSKPHRSSRSTNLFYSQLISSVKRFLAVCVPKYQATKTEWIDYRKRVITSCKTHGINIVCDSFKYFCYYRYNIYVKDIETYPKPEVLIDFHPPRLENYLNRRLSGRLRLRNLSLLVSLCCLKRDLLDVPSSYVENALEKHRATLTKKVETPVEALNFVESFLKEKVSLLKERGDSLLKRVTYPLSRNSSFLNRKKDMGAQGELSLNLERKSVRGMNLYKFALMNSSLKIHKENLDNDLINKANQAIHGNARVCAILEPLKVRIVTCEDQYNQVIKPVQVGMWEELLRDECFLLTRNENMVDYVQRYMIHDPLPFHVSGDYSAATDNLDPLLIKSVLTELSQLLPHNLRNVFIKNGGKHFLHYPDGKVLEQSNGQLMGSLTSFPILCLLNQVAYEYARAICPTGLSEHYLINGDDIYFKCNLEGYRVWTQIVKQFGLNPSLGKNYLSKKVFLINSRYFLIRNLNITEVPFVNWRLINSRSNYNTLTKEISRDIEISSPISHDPSSLGSMYRKFMEQAGITDLTRVSSLMRRLDRIFFISHRENICRSPKELYIPSVLGGLGALTIGEYRNTKLLSFERKARMLEGFKFRLGLYALRKHINMSSPDPINRVGCAMAEAVCHSEKSEGIVNNPLFVPELSRVLKAGSKTPSLRKFLRAIGKSDFLKTRAPDGVPNLLVGRRANRKVQ